MMKRTIQLAAMALLCVLGQTVSCLAEDATLKTGEKQDTLLYVRTIPPGAKVLLDGKQLGTSDGVFHVEPGVGKVLVELEGHHANSKQVTIQANSITRIELMLESQAQTEGDHSITNPPPFTIQQVPFTVGPSFFQKGDLINITEVKATSPNLKNGDKVVVKGYYILASAPKASLCLFATATTGSGKSPIRPGQTINITEGQGQFELSETMDCDGYLHVTFYSISLGKPFGGLYFGTAKQMEEIKHWDVRSWYTAGTASARAAMSEPEDARFTGHLPQGTVELVGVAPYPPGSADSWWKPDGSSVNMGPFQPQNIRRLHVSSDGEGRTFLLRCKNLPADASHPAVRLPASTNWEGSAVVAANGEIVSDCQMLCASLPASVQMVNYRVGVSMGDWDTVITRKADSDGGTSSFSRDGRQWTVTFEKATEGTLADTTQVKLTTTLSYPEMYSQLVAVTSDGNKHATSIGYHGGNGAAVFQNLPLSSIKEFQFQVRPYYWVEFKNVSLQSGQKTEVQVVSPDTPTKPAAHDAVADDTIVEGVGWKGVRVGGSREDLIKALGKPDNDPSSDWLKWPDKHIDCTFYSGCTLVCEVRFNPGFEGALANGIKLGSSGSEMLKIYGEPEHTVDRGNGARMYEYSKKGILFWSNQGKITQIVLFKPYSPAGNTESVTNDHAEAKKKAIEAAEAWLALVDKGQYDQSWETAAEAFKKGVNKTNWVNSLTGGRKPLGDVKSRKLKSQQYTKALPGAPDGQYVILQYETSFANKASAVETITPMLDNGPWKVSGYYLK
jgi:hypothetical protein